MSKGFIECMMSKGFIECMKFRFIGHIMKHDGLGTYFTPFVSCVILNFVC